MEITSTFGPFSQVIFSCIRHRTGVRCAAAILFLPSADIVRLDFDG
jgi:hypothetical protein